MFVLFFMVATTMRSVFFGIIVFLMIIMLLFVFAAIHMITKHELPQEIYHVFDMS